MEEYASIVLGIIIDNQDHLVEVEKILNESGYSPMIRNNLVNPLSIVAYPIDKSRIGWENYEYGFYDFTDPMCGQIISSTNFIAKYGSK